MEPGCLRPLIFQALKNAREGNERKEQRARLQFERGCFSFHAFRAGRNAGKFLRIPFSSSLLFHGECTLSSISNCTLLILFIRSCISVGNVSRINICHSSIFFDQLKTNIDSCNAKAIVHLRSADEKSESNLDRSGVRYYKIY